MIASNALKQAFKNLTITYDSYKSNLVTKQEVTKDVLFSYGDQKEFNKWVAGRSNTQKYPLIWYVKPPYQQPRSKNFIEVDAQIILFTATKQEYYNDTRQLINYNEILNPLYNLVIERLNKVNYIDILSTIININDEPCYGIDLDKRGSEGDFKSVSTKGTKSIGLDYLDGKLIDLKLRIHPVKCNNY